MTKPIEDLRNELEYAHNEIDNLTDCIGLMQRDIKIALNTLHIERANEEEDSHRRRVLTRAIDRLESASEWFELVQKIPF